MITPFMARNYQHNVNFKYKSYNTSKNIRPKDVVLVPKRQLKILSGLMKTIGIIALTFLGIICHDGYTKIKANKEFVMENAPQKYNEIIKSKKSMNPYTTWSKAAKEVVIDNIERDYFTKGQQMIRDSIQKANVVNSSILQK